MDKATCTKDRVRSLPIWKIRLMNLNMKRGRKMLATLLSWTLQNKVSSMHLKKAERFLCLIIIPSNSIILLMAWIISRVILTIFSLMIFKPKRVAKNGKLLDKSRNLLLTSLKNNSPNDVRGDKSVKFECIIVNTAKHRID